MKYHLICFCALLLIAGFSLKPVYSQTWQVPEDKKSKVAPFKFSPETVKKGESIYFKNCQSCHGLPGKNNFANITPSPGDPAIDKFQNQKDGELFFKITAGKTPMPEFRNILSEEERWDVVSFLRSLNKNYIQPNPEEKAAFKGKIILLTMEYITSEKKIKVFAKEKNKEISNPAKGIDILLFVKRYFGLMKVGETMTTNENGIALFEFPANTPGDKKGMVEIIAKIEETDVMPGAEVSAKLAIGKPTEVKSLIDERAWWSVSRNAPIWLIVIYAGAVILVWGFIFKIILQILKIRKISN